MSLAHGNFFLQQFFRGRPVYLLPGFRVPGILPVNIPGLVSVREIALGVRVAADTGAFLRIIWVAVYLLPRDGRLGTLGGGGSLRQISGIFKSAFLANTLHPLLHHLYRATEGLHWGGVRQGNHGRVMVVKNLR